MAVSNIKTVMVTGANGFIGTSLIDNLRGEGYHVIQAVRRASEAVQGEYFVCGDINGKTDWQQVLQNVDAVVHLAARVHVLHETVADPVSEYRAANIDATVRLAQQASENGVKRFVFISTIGVLGNYSAEPLCETDPPNPANAYAASKLEAERQLLAFAQRSGLEVVVIRPPLVYGPGVKANFLRLMLAIKRGKALPFGLICNQRDFISVTNLSSLIACCITHPAAVGEIFLAADGEPVSTPALIRKLSVLLGVQARLIPVPVWLLYFAAAMLRKKRFYHSICSSLRIDTRKAKTLLGWVPPQPFDEGLKQTVEWYRG